MPVILKPTKANIAVKLLVPPGHPIGTTPRVQSNHPGSEALLICDLCASLGPMKIPFKYGLLITLGVMAWVLIARTTITDPQSIVHKLGTPIFFNVLQFVMIYLGLKALEREKRDRPTFKEGIKTGVAISVIYALTAALFFVVVLVVVGPKWLASEPGAAEQPTLRVAAGAFVGLFIGTTIFGLIYSTVISFFLAKRRSDEQ
jgi:uncharacterized membrane protein